MKKSWFFSAVVFGGVLGSSFSFAYSGRLGGGGMISSESSNTLMPAQIPEIKSLVEIPVNGKSDILLKDASAGLYSFYPMGGTLFGDVYVNNYVDLDSGGGLLDWACDDWTYNGHDAHDIDIRSFGEQAIGVPVFAVQDGTVTAVHDGEFDMNISGQNLPANYVIINYGNGRICYYWHLKKNSVAVMAGQQVTAGQQIGLVGSSGQSSGPHLHFATYENGVAVEPQKGFCRAGDDYWVSQVSKKMNTYVFDFGISGVNLSSYGWASELPRKIQITRTETFYPWILLNNLPANSAWQIQIFKPDHVLWGEWNNSFGNSTFYRRSWWWYDFSGVTDYGTWRFVYRVNGTKILDAPFEVVAAVVPNFNRPPSPVTAALEPAHPTSDDVPVCRVNTDFVFDDMDYDIVRYEYVWTINNTEVRRVVSAASSDAIPHHLAAAGDWIACTVTPGDGKDSGASVTVSSLIYQQTCHHSLSGDINGDCRVDLDDFNIMAGHWLEGM